MASAARAEAKKLAASRLSAAILAGFAEGLERAGSRSKSEEDGLVAQLVEQRIENPRVGGSIPPQATKLLSDGVQRRPRKSKKPLRINALGLFVS